jgi:hypothetical protein
VCTENLIDVDEMRESPKSAWCLDHLVVVSEAHLRRMLQAYAGYYNKIRTHRSLDKLECNVMRKLSAVAFIVITIMITAPLPAIAYTQADADACTPDAMRLCASAIPDVSRVAFCLAHNKQQLNSACAAVFNRPRGAGATRERRGNIQKTNF